MRNDLKTVLVSHIDLDGYGCNIMAMRYLGMDLPAINVNYDELADRLMDVPRESQLLITDLSVPENLAGLLEEFAHVIVIDHHKSTKWALEWAKGKPDVEVTVSTERCATWLLYDYLKRAFGFGDTIMDEWARLVDDYDRYVLEDPDSRRLNALFYISNRDRFVTDAMRYIPQVVLANNKERVDRYLQQQKEYVDQTVVFTLGHPSDNTVLVFAEKNKSAIAECLMKNYDVDLVYVVDLHNMAVSLRSSERSRIDCSKIAQTIHPEGGGHKNASGASLKEVCREWCVSTSEDIINPEMMFKMILNFPTKDLPRYTEEDD